MTNVKFHALLSSRFNNLSNYIFEHSYSKYFYSLEVASFLYEAIAPETDILVGMSIAAGFSQCDVLTSEEMQRVRWLSSISGTTTKIESSDALVIGSVHLIELRRKIEAHQRSNCGFIDKDLHSSFNAKGAIFSRWFSIYKQIQEFPVATEFYDLIQKALLIEHYEPNEFVNLRPVYKIVLREEDKEFPNVVVQLIKKLRFHHFQKNKTLYVSHWGVDASQVLSYWATIIQAHHPELDIKRSEKKFKDFQWSYNPCDSFTAAVNRHRYQSLIINAMKHDIGHSIDPYQRLIEML